MAEAWLKKLAGDRFEAESAGLEPGALNPLAVEAMAEAGGEKCPLFPRVTKTLHWSFPDPSTFTGAHKERLAKTREVHYAIKAAVEDWLTSLPDGTNTQ